MPGLIGNAQNEQNGIKLKLQKIEKWKKLNVKWVNYMAHQRTNEWWNSVNEWKYKRDKQWKDKSLSGWKGDN